MELIQVRRDEKGRFIKGHRSPQEWKNKMREKNKKKLKEYYSNPENKKSLLKNLAEAVKSRTKETFKKCAKTHSRNIALGFAKTRKGQKNTLEHNRKIGKANKGIIRSKEYKDNLSKKIKEKWKDKKYAERVIKSWRKSLQKKPSSFEKRIILLCSKYRLPFIYTGDGRILVGYKNPDFINKEDKIIIEVFLDYFKIRDYGSVENYIKKRGEHFKKYGYKTIFICESEIANKNWKQICLNKINGFVETWGQGK